MLQLTSPWMKRSIAAIALMLTVVTTSVPNVSALTFTQNPGGTPDVTPITTDPVFLAAVYNPTNSIISGISANPSTFKPSNGEKTDIRFNLSQPATVWLDIMQTGNPTPINRLFHTSGIHMNAGSYDYQWNGLNGSNTLVLDGTYQYLITAQADSDSQIYTAQDNITVTSDAALQPVVITTGNPTPNPFDPHVTQTTVSYTLSSQANLDIQVWGPASNTTPLVELSPSPFTQNAGTYSISWDGKVNGTIVDPGNYTIRFTGKNSSMQNPYVTNVPVTVAYNTQSNQTPVVSNVYANPSNFNPYNNETTTIFYTLSNPANTVTIQVSGNGVSSSFSGGTSAGTNQVFFNGKNGNNPFPVGSYAITVTASNNAGQTSANGTLTINNNTNNCTYSNTCNCNTYNNCNCNTYSTTGCNNCLYVACTPGTIIQNWYVWPEIFNPRQNETSTIYYSLNQTATVTTQILDRNGVAIRTLVDNITRSSNNYAYTTAYGSYNYADQWNGRDVNGNIVPDGIYQFQVTAYGNGIKDIKTAWVEVNTDGQIIGFPNGSTCAGYIDVTSNSPYCKAIQLMTDDGVFTGYSDGTFRPYQQINRAETVKVILLALSIPLNNTMTTLFRDTNNGAWYATYLSTAKLLGIIRGYPDGTFRPEQTVNRVELLKVFLESSGVNIPYCNYAPYNDTPVNADTRWYIDYACYAKSNSLMHDDGAGHFSPAAPMTRGDVADLFYQFETRGLYNKYNNPYVNGTCTYNNNCAYNCTTYDNNNCNCAYNNNCGYNCTYTANCNCTYNAATHTYTNCYYPTTTTTTNTQVYASVTANPSTFNPYNNQTTIISYTLSQPVSSAYIQILNSSGTVVRTIYNAGTSSTYSNSSTFDGRATPVNNYTPGNILPVGNYTARVFNGATGLSMGSAALYITNNTTTTYGVPVITSLSVNPSSFHPGSQSTIVNYTLDQTPTSAYIQIINSSNTVVRTIYNTGTSSTSTNAVIFNGYDNNNSNPSPLAPGTYTVKVNAVNSSGTGMGTTTVSIQ